MVQTIIRYLPHSWVHVKHSITLDENVKTFEDISRHLELKVEHLEEAKANGLALVDDTDSRWPSGPKRGKVGRA